VATRERKAAKDEEDRLAAEAHAAMLKAEADRRIEEQRRADAETQAKADAEQERIALERSEAEHRERQRLAAIAEEEERIRLTEAAQVKAEAERKIENQRTAAAEAAAEAKRLARKKWDEEQREIKRLADLADEEERRRLDADAAYRKQEKDARQQQFWAKLRRLAKHYRISVVGFAIAGIAILAFVSLRKNDVVLEAKPSSAPSISSAPVEPAKPWLEGDWAINQTKNRCKYIMTIKFIDENKLKMSINDESNEYTWTEPQRGEVRAQNSLEKYIFIFGPDQIMVSDGTDSGFTLSKCTKL
jgi:hypothetical protein